MPRISTVFPTGTYLCRIAWKSWDFVGRASPGRENSLVFHTGPNVDRGAILWRSREGNKLIFKNYHFYRSDRLTVATKCSQWQRPTKSSHSVRTPKNLVSESRIFFTFLNRDAAAPIPPSKRRPPHVWSQAVWSTEANVCDWDPGSDVFSSDIPEYQWLPWCVSKQWPSLERLRDRGKFRDRTEQLGLCSIMMKFY